MFGKKEQPEEQAKEADVSNGEEQVPPPSQGSGHTTDASANWAQPPPKASAWMYKSFHIGPITLPYYASPLAQLLIVSFVCFLCPGMFNAVTGLGGSGQIDPTDTDKSQIALYSCFAAVGFFAGSITNVVGTRLALSFGGFGYFLYVTSLLCYNHTHNAGYLIFAGAMEGISAGCLWAAQGTVMMSYPEEENKGKFIGIFWVIFNLGSVIGSLITLGSNIHSKSSQASDGTYVAFIVLMFVGFLLGMTLVDAKYVRRTNGTHVIAMKHPSWKTELIGLRDILMTDAYIILFFPMFFASNWFYTYQFNGVNGANFDIRTRALNNVMYWVMQMVGAFLFGRLLDITWLGRKTRARMGWTIIFVVTMGIWGGGYAWQRKMYTRENTPGDYGKIDWTDGRFGGPFVLYMFYGFADAIFQTFVYWSMGALSNNSRKLANFAGFYKGIQSAGAAGAWATDHDKVPYIDMFASCWGLVSGSLLIAAPIIWMKIEDHTALEKDLKFTDETMQEVVEGLGEKSEGHEMQGQNQSHGQDHE